MTRIVIIGHGPAGHKLVERLDRAGHDDITVIGAEESTYNRALLTKVISGELAASMVGLPTHPERVLVHRGVRAEHIDRKRAVVRTDDGRDHAYDKLVLATGARCRIPELDGVYRTDGSLARGVWPLRTLGEADRLRRETELPRRIIVLGGGVLGIETAQSLASRGHEVVLLTGGGSPMPNELDDAAARILTGILGEGGVHVDTDAEPVGYRPETVLLRDGTRIDTDMLIVCTGTLPETTLASQAGLTVRDGGVAVDERMCTDDPSIFALGDCAMPRWRPRGLVTTAWQQAETLAATLACGDFRAARQKEILRTQVNGFDLACLGSPDLLAPEHTEVEHVTLADPAKRRYARLALESDRVLAGVLIGLPEALATISQLYEAGSPLPADRLALLLGMPARGFGKLPEPGDAVLCHCNNVTASTLTAAYRDGAHDLPALARATRATTGCGSCADEVRRLCVNLAAESDGRAEHDSPEKEDAA